MNMIKLQDNLERLKTTLYFYDGLLRIKYASKIEVENIRIKRKFVKEQILKLTIHNKKILKELEDRL